MDAQKRVGRLGLRLGQRAERTKMVTDADLHAYAELTGDRIPCTSMMPSPRPLAAGG